MRIRYKSASFVFALLLLALAIAVPVILLITMPTWITLIIGCFVLFVLLAFAVIWPQIKYNKAEAKDLWNPWHDCITDPNQCRRVAEALEPDFTLKSLDQTFKRAKFASAKGRTYTTTLLKCSCGDFHSRKLPCKHMYKLAMELGLDDLPVPPKNTQKVGAR